MGWGFLLIAVVVTGAVTSLYWMRLLRSRSAHWTEERHQERQALETRERAALDNANRLVEHLSRLTEPLRLGQWVGLGDSLLDSAVVLLGVEIALLLRYNPVNFSLESIASRGLALKEEIRILPGEGLLGQAYQKGGLRSLQEPPSGGFSAAESFLKTPCLILPIYAQKYPAGLLVLSRSKPFDAQETRLAQLLASYAGISAENAHSQSMQNTARREVVETLLRALELKDTCTHTHVHRTAALARSIAEDLHLPLAIIEQIEYGALLHDLGKVGIDDAILKKPSVLSAEEYDVIKKHPEFGYRILRHIPGLRGAAYIALYHQEWFNGKGYPHGISREEIPLGARVVSIVDAWDAMTSERPYHRAMSKGLAAGELRRAAGTQFDPILVEAFLQMVERLDQQGVATTETENTPPLVNG